jgi:methyl acetate hydrolase
MTSTQQSRREILKVGAVLAATASFPASIRFAAAQSKAAGAAHPNAQIDAVLRRAVDTKDVPGVVAVAATDKGILYEGAFGTRLTSPRVPR